MNIRERAGKIARVAFHQVERLAAFSDLMIRRAALYARGKDAGEREARHWSAQARAHTWQEHPVIRDHINTRVSGEPGVNWLGFFAREFGPSRGFERALNLGCGKGDLEVHAFSIGLGKSFTSIDVSKKAIAIARERLGGFPVDFRLLDANRMRLEPGAYDAVFAASILHHFIELEHVLDQVALCLKPRGFFVFDEYVGPSRFQWKPEQLRIINELLAALAPRYRRDLRRGLGRIKNKVFQSPLDETSRDSPFEAARSEEILPLAGERFEIVIKRDYGGAILHPLLDSIVGNFSPESHEDVSLIKRLALLEEELERAGVVGSDFTVVVAGKA